MKVDPSALRDIQGLGEKTEASSICPDLNEVGIYNQSDMYLKFCDMLVNFSKEDMQQSHYHEGRNEAKTKKRAIKAQQKMAMNLLQIKLN